MSTHLFHYYYIIFFLILNESESPYYWNPFFLNSILGFSKITSYDFSQLAVLSSIYFDNLWLVPDSVFHIHIF